MIRRGDYFLTPSGLSYRVDMIECAGYHSGVVECRVMMECGSDGVVTIATVCQYCDRPATVTASRADRPPGMVQVDPAHPPYPTSPERTE